tara:strand:+ start:91 stop:1881 length:1791 start_codon:yes stop_codon:yes gene_type:complete
MTKPNIERIDISSLSNGTIYDFETYDSGDLLYISKELKSGNTNYELIRSNGNTIIWKKDLGTNGGSLSKIGPNGDVVIISSKNYYPTSSWVSKENPYITCIDKDGNKKWEKEFIGDGADAKQMDVKISNLGSTYFTFKTESPSISVEGNQLGIKNYNESAVINDLNSNQDEDILIIEIDTSSGNIRNSFRIGSSNQDQKNFLSIDNVNGGFNLSGTTYGGSELLINGNQFHSWQNSKSFNPFISSIDNNGTVTLAKLSEEVSLDDQYDLGFLTTNFNIYDQGGYIKYAFLRYIIEIGSENEGHRKHRNIFAFPNSQEIKEGYLYQIENITSIEDFNDVHKYIYDNIYSSDKIINLIDTKFEFSGGPGGDAYDEIKVSYNKNGDVYLLGTSLSGEQLFLKSENVFNDLSGQNETGTTKTFNQNFREYKFYQRANGKYEIKTESGFDELTGISTLKFPDKTIDVIDDVKGVFDQVTGLNTKSGEMFRLYNAAFARFPDSDGLKYWIEQYSSGRDTKRVVSKSFLGSSEFAARYGTNISHEVFVNNLYKNVLGREADISGLLYWSNQLASGFEARHEVLLGFSESAENKLLFTDMTGFG